MVKKENIDECTEDKIKIVKSSARRDAERKMKSQKLNEFYT